ncbi:unnamed protein product [Schistosoma margrebowiei]|uniref:Uncharacterized protein n=1 Tax=Schistosoma margrebowiei TaxID=48269 RepID=A0A183N3Z9_9TREM|nr:unnamed protein product [Schistosoma margrebowiei]
MQEKTTSVAAASVAVGINIHKGKRKILRCNTACSNRITFDEKASEDVNPLDIWVASLMKTVDLMQK